MLAEKIYQTKDIKKVPTRNGYGEALVELGENNPNVVVLSADLTESTRSHYFKEKFPERFIEMGIAEQNMLGVAAGLALSGKIPFVSTYSVFCPGRNWDQLRVSVCYNQANVKLTGAHAGVSVGPDGATHQGLEDIAITRCLPNLTVISPCDYLETKKATLAAGNTQGPVYLRFTREATPVFTTPKTHFQIGKAEIFKPGSDVTIVACGPLVFEALLAAHELEKENISAEVINSHTIKPLDKTTIITSLKKTKALVTVEEHQVMGGMGSAVVEMLTQEFPVPAKLLGMEDRFGESGTAEELLHKFKLTHPFIIEAVKNVLKRKSKY